MRCLGIRFMGPHPRKLILPFTRNIVMRSSSTTHSASLIQKDRIPRNVFDASAMASWHASSKPFGDWAITSDRSND
jgi:hypothetical protein